MSTRSQLAFYNQGEKDLNKYETLIYRHCDGYPEGVLPDILPVLKDFNKHRGLDDIEYAAAYLVYTLKAGLIAVNNEFREKGKAYPFDYTGLGICGRSCGFHGDIEYFYAIYPDHLDVYETGNTDPNTWKHLEKHKL